MTARSALSALFGPRDFDEIRVINQVIGDTPGMMLDVGAHQGHSLEPFVSRGWSAHAFEPDPANREILTSRCPSVVIDPRAVSDVNGEHVPLFTSDVSTGITTLSPFHETHVPTNTVETVRLDTYIEESRIDAVDFLKIDIEGWDLAALRSFPWNTHKPKVILCEFEDNKTLRLGHDVNDMAQFLKSKGYDVIVSEWEPIVEYGTQHRWKRLARYPVTLDRNSWGNLIASEPALSKRIEQLGKAAGWRLRSRRLADRLANRSMPPR
jgi:FkbM family methyltransferase